MSNFYGFDIFQFAILAYLPEMPEVLKPDQSNIFGNVGRSVGIAGNVKSQPFQHFRSVPADHRNSSLREIGGTKTVPSGHHLMVHKTVPYRALLQCHFFLKGFCWKTGAL